MRRDSVARAQRKCGQKELDGKAEAQLIALSCGPAPERRARWTLRLLAARPVELEVVDEIFHETVRQTLKNKLQPWQTLDALV